MKELELLAPARNADIGIAAIGCGADAVYMAGPEFGARQAAGNSMSDIRKVCEYAHRFGARIFMTLNTILFDEELEAARKLLEEAKEAGVDAIIAQDPAVWTLTDLPVHASTQCAIRTPEKARFYESLGSSRIVLEREMSLKQIRAVHDAVGSELEFFVHGALCVCYSGQCYMSEAISGRSANRGECIQACRSLYDLEDEDGNVLVRNKALLSLKDYKLIHRIEDLAEAGVTSFKIEGRLKNISYVRNVVREYSAAMDDLVAKYPDRYRRASFGKVEGGFIPDLEKTFNRRYTELFLDGVRGKWSSMDAPKFIGEEIGTVARIDSVRGKGPSSQVSITVRPLKEGLSLNNGDGFAFVAKGRSEIIGFRGDVCQGSNIFCKDVPGLFQGARLFRNVDTAFEKSIEADLPHRVMPVSVRIRITGDEGSGRNLEIKAESQDGRTLSYEMPAGKETAGNPDRMKAMFASQISKESGDFSFSLASLEIATEDGAIPFLQASVLNSIRRDIAEKMAAMPCGKVPLKYVKPDPSANADKDGQEATFIASINDKVGCPSGTLCYKANAANHVAKEIYMAHGAESVDDAFEISHRKDAELMRTRYCIRHELGMCPVHQKAKSSGKLFLVNNGKRYALGFDCARCEMTVNPE